MLYKQQFYAELKRRFAELSLSQRNGQSALCMAVFKKYRIPLGMVSDIVTLRTDMEYALEVMLYCIAATLSSLAKDSILNIEPVNLSMYFSEREIKEYSNYKYQTQTLEFPYTFESLMVEIKPDEQYIGKITVKELMKLRDAQVINYNANTQRTMTLKRGNDFEYYKIALNKKAVNKISELYRNRDFIPNTITFNLSPEADFIYKNGKLTINSATAFDIVDGYHRYIAMSNLYNLDETFDYPMEVRVMFLSEENAKQFIYQEAQHTPLAKANLNTMNKNAVSVKVCRFVKNNLGDDVINQNGIINEALFVRLIEIFYIEKGSYERSKIIEVATKISDTINNTLKIYPKLLDSRWDNNFTIMFFGLASKQNLSGKTLYEKAKEKANKIIKEVKIEQLTARKLISLLK